MRSPLLLYAWLLLTNRRSVASAARVTVDGLTVDDAWLRDHCTACGNLGTLGVGARSWSSLLAASNASLVQTQVTEDTVVLHWYDGFNDTISKQWLRQHAPNESAVKPMPANQWMSVREPWSAGGNIPIVSAVGSTGNGSAAWRLELLRTLRRHGALLLKGLMPFEGDDAAQQRAVERLLQVDASPYGSIFTTQGYGIPPDELAVADKTVSWLSSRVEGNAQVSLEPHTDQSFWPEPPGLIGFHMLQPATGGGGETVLADGLAAAQILQRTDPEGYDALTRVRVEWSYTPDDSRIGDSEAAGA